MLPNSTERLVSITGTTGTISQCVYQVCNVLLDVRKNYIKLYYLNLLFIFKTFFFAIFKSPPRSATIPYDPRSKTSGFASGTVGNDVS